METGKEEYERSTVVIKHTIHRSKGGLSCGAFSSRLSGERRAGNRLSRSAIDAPSASASESREKLGPTWKPLSLEVQLWVEVSLLIAFGFIMIYSASSIPALTRFARPQSLSQAPAFLRAAGRPDHLHGEPHLLPYRIRNMPVRCCSAFSCCSSWC